MYFFYIDESGDSSHRFEKKNPDGSVTPLDHVYVLLAVSLFEHRWYGFESTLNRKKLELLSDITAATGQRLDLPDAEMHSRVIRNPKSRTLHPFFGFLTQLQLSSLVDLFYRQLEYNHMHLFAVVIDKRKLADYIDSEKMKRKAYELLLERIQHFMREYHPKHLGVIVADDMNVRTNRSLGLKHSYFQRKGTTSGAVLRNIVEMPFFVQSELSNGIQLADLCAYNVYRAFKYEDPKYAFFQRTLGRFYNSHQTASDKLDGIKVFPNDSVLIGTLSQLEKELAARKAASKKGP